MRKSFQKFLKPSFFFDILRNLLPTFVDPVRRPKQNQVSTKCIRILVAANGGIGNAIQSTPLVLALRKLWPSSFIVFLGPSGDLFENWSAVDSEVQNVMDAKKFGPFDKTFVTFAATLGEGWSAIFADKTYGKILMPKESLNRPFTKAEWECCLDLARHCGYDEAAPPYYVSVSQPELNFSEGHPLVCFIPGSKPEILWRHKRWQHYEKLAHLLLARFPSMRILILGTKDDPVTKSLLELEHVIDLRGKLTLSQTAWTLKHTDLAIGNDCGPSHIADAVLADHIVLFGPSCEIKNGPRNRGDIIRFPVPCSPCQYDHNVLNACPKALCMENITPQTVFLHAEHILSKPPFKIPAYVEREKRNKLLEDSVHLAR